MTNFTKFKGNVHYCPKCGLPSHKCMMIKTIDTIKRDIGKQKGFPHYGETIECTKCKWAGTWFIKPVTYNKLENIYRNRTAYSKLNTIKKNMFRR